MKGKVGQSSKSCGNTYVYSYKGVVRRGQGVWHQVPSVMPNVNDCDGADRKTVMGSTWQDISTGE